MGDNVKRKSLHMDLAKLKADGYSHLVFNLPRAEPKASVALDIHRSSDRDLVYRFSLLSYLNLFKPSVVAQTPAGSLSYNLTFPDFTKSWQAFQILVEPLSSAKKCRALIRKTVPWNRAESEFFLAVNRTVSVQADIQLHAPKTLMDQEDQFLKLEIISVPGCEYSILMKFDWIGSWSQIFRFYPSVVVSLFCAILLDCLSRQLLARSRGGQTPSVLTALSRLSFRRVFLVPELVSLGLGFLDAWQLNIPLADDYALRTEGLGLPLLLFILGIPAWTLCFLVVLVLHAAVVFGGNTLHLFVVRYLGGSLGVGSIITEIVCLGLNKFPFVIAVALTAISYSTCGAVGLLFGLIVCIWKLFQIYEEQLEDFITESGDAESKDEESSESTLNILSTITVLWLCVTLLNIPSLLAWLKYSNNALDKDPSFWTSVVVCLGAGVLWRDNFESKHANRLKFVAVIAWLSSLCVLLFGLTSIYRISYFIAVPIAVLALSQLV